MLGSKRATVYVELLLCVSRRAHMQRSGVEVHRNVLDVNGLVMKVVGCRQPLTCLVI